MPERDQSGMEAMRQPAAAGARDTAPTGQAERAPVEYALLGVVCLGVVVGAIGVVGLSVPVALAGVGLAAAGLAGFWLRAPKDS